VLFVRCGGAYEPLGHLRDHRPIVGSWRHGSFNGFLDNAQAGRHCPECGLGDEQADCFLRVVGPWFL